MYLYTIPTQPISIENVQGTLTHDALFPDIKAGIGVPGTLYCNPSKANAISIKI